MDEESKLQQGQQWLEKLLGFAALQTPVKAELSEDQLSDGSFWLTIDAAPLKAEQVQILTGEDGSVIDSIQYLINTTLNLGRSEEERRAYTVELDGYRLRRQAELKALAELAAEHVQSTGKEYELKDLSSAERRQVHTFLKSFPDLETYSRGQEPDRRLIVRPLQQ